MSLLDKNIVKPIVLSVQARIKSAWMNFIFIFPFVLIAVCIACMVFSVIQIYRVRIPQYDQNAAERWGQDSIDDYRQVSLFGQGVLLSHNGIPQYSDPLMSLNVSDIEEVRENLETIISTTERSSGRVSNPMFSGQRWADAYSTTFRTSAHGIIEGEITQNHSETWVVGISGNYTLFHPMEYLSGSFLAPEPVQPNSIVINDQLAWNLFKSYNVLDQSVEINGREYIIIGVVREGRHSTHEDAGAGSSRAYIYFEELVYFVSLESGDFFENDDMDWGGYQNDPHQASIDDIAVMVYEAVLPDPIRNIAYNDLKASVKAYDESIQNFYIINNSDRFTLYRLVNDYFPINEQHMERNSFAFPYWEISAQITEDYLRLYWTLIGAGSIVILISALCLHSNIKRRKKLEVKRV